MKQTIILQGVLITALATDYINIQQTGGDLNLNVVSNAGKSDVKLTSAGSIIDASTSENPNIYAKGISMNAKAGSIGLSSDDIEVYSNYNNSGGTLTALAKGYINIEQTSGNLSLNVVSNAGQSDVKLTSAGSILDSSASENPNIYAKGINLNAKAGSIGLYADDIDIYSNYKTTGGTLTALATGYINLEQTSGNLSLNVVSNAGQSDVKLTSAGSIIDASTGENPNIYARGINLNAKAGSIGLYSDDVNIYSNYNSSNGTLKALATGYINLRQGNSKFVS